MCEQSLTNHAIRIRMGRIFKALTLDSKFVPESVVSGFKDWIELSGFSTDEKKIVEKASHEILIEIERRVRWLKAELQDGVFRNH